MTHDTRTSDDIEREIVDERAQMSETLNDLQKKFSVEAIVSDLAAMVRNQGGEFGRSISDTVGRNPAAVVLVGVGLAWLFLGQDRKPSAPATGCRSGHEAERQNRRAFARWSTQEQPKEQPGEKSFPGDDPYWFSKGEISGNYRSREPGKTGRDKTQAGMDGAANGMLGAIRNAASSVGGSVSDAAGSLGHTASDLTERLSDGLENLSEEARARVMSARRAAHEARLSSEAVMHKGSRVASSFFEDQPLVVGALAVALGAAIGGILPHSKIEDDTLGNSSDHLFAEAQALFRAERDKAMAAVRVAASDVKDEIRDAGSDLADLLPEGKTVGDVVVDRAADAASRVLDHATGEAGLSGSQNSAT